MLAKQLNAPTAEIRKRAVQLIAATPSDQSTALLRLPMTATAPWPSPRNIFSPCILLDSGCSNTSGTYATPWG